MPLYPYTYSISLDCPGGEVNPSALKADILDSTLAPYLSHLNSSDDTLEILFDTELSAPDEEILTNIVTTEHNPASTVSSLTYIDIYVVEQGDTSFVPPNPSQTIPEAGHSFGGITVAVEWALLNTNPQDSKLVTIKVGPGTYDEDVTFDNIDMSWIGIEGTAPDVVELDWAYTLDDTNMPNLESLVKANWNTFVTGAVTFLGSKLKFWRNIVVDHTVNPDTKPVIGMHLEYSEISEPSDFLVLQVPSSHSWTSCVFDKGSLLDVRHIVMTGVYLFSTGENCIYRSTSVPLTIYVTKGNPMDFGWGKPFPCTLLNNGNFYLSRIGTMRLYDSGFQIENNARFNVIGQTGSQYDSYAWCSQATKDFVSWGSPFLACYNNSSSDINVGDSLHVHNYQYSLVTNTSAFISIGTALHIYEDGPVVADTDAKIRLQRDTTAHMTGLVFKTTAFGRILCKKVFFTSTSGTVEFYAALQSSIFMEAEPEKPNGSSLKVVLSPKWNKFFQYSNSFIGTI